LRESPSPFAYAGTLEARVDFVGLLQGRRSFSNLRFSDATINLVKSDNEPWNFQMLVESATKGVEIPSIQMRAGRVNLKFNQSKSVLYFDDADLDVQPVGRAGAVEMRLSGVPLRTDRAIQNGGHFFLQGTSTPSPKGQLLDLTLDLESTEIEALARLSDASVAGLQGALSGEGRVFGLASALTVEGAVHVDDNRRARLFDLPLRGSLDLSGSTVDLKTAAKQPWTIALAGEKFLDSPHWQATVDFSEASLAAAIAGARRLGAAVPDDFAAEGALSGSVVFRSALGLSGGLEVRDASLSLPEARNITSPSLPVKLSGETVSLGPAVLTAGPAQTAQVEGRYARGENGGLELKITTRGLAVADLGSLGLRGVPMLDRVSRGTLQGTLQYRGGSWSGDYELHNASVVIEGLSEPVQIRSAMVNAGADRVSVSRIDAQAGDIDFTGDYRWQTAAEIPHRFYFQIQDASAVQLEGLFRPILSREGGFLARTLRLGGPAPPDWFVQRKAEGTISVRSLAVGDSRLRVDSATVNWEGALVRITKIDAKMGGAAFVGDLRVDLSDRAPKYHLAGTVGGLPYGGGDLDFSGAVDGAGTGATLMSSLRGQGTFRGRAITFSPDAEFRSVSGRFALAVANAAPRWKLSELELAQSGDTYTGEGATQANGKLVLDLEANGKPVRYTGSLEP